MHTLIKHSKGFHDGKIGGELHTNVITSVIQFVVALSCFCPRDDSSLIDDS